jgi:hypothetical protein
MADKLDNHIDKVLEKGEQQLKELIQNLENLPEPVANKLRQQITVNGLPNAMGGALGLAKLYNGGCLDEELLHEIARRFHQHASQEDIDAMTAICTIMCRPHKAENH